MFIKTKKYCFLLQIMLFEALDESQFTAGVFCNSSKAFDCVNHELLIKLEMLSIGKLANELLNSMILSFFFNWASFGTKVLKNQVTRRP